MFRNRSRGRSRTRIKRGRIGAGRISTLSGAHSHFFLLPGGSSIPLKIWLSGGGPRVPNSLHLEYASDSEFEHNVWNNLNLWRSFVDTLSLLFEMNSDYRYIDLHLGWALMDLWALTQGEYLCINNRWKWITISTQMIGIKGLFAKIIQYYLYWLFGYRIRS